MCNVSFIVLLGFVIRCLVFVCLLSFAVGFSLCERCCRWFIAYCLLFVCVCCLLVHV